MLGIRCFATSFLSRYENFNLRNIEWNRVRQKCSIESTHEIFKKLDSILADVLVAILILAVFFQDYRILTTFEKVKCLQAVADVTDWTAYWKEGLMHVNATPSLVDKLIIRWILFGRPKQMPAEIVDQLCWLQFEMRKLLDATVSRSVIQFTFLQISYNWWILIEALN